MYFLLSARISSHSPWTSDFLPTFLFLLLIYLFLWPTRKRLSAGSLLDYEKFNECWQHWRETFLPSNNHNGQQLLRETWSLMVPPPFTMECWQVSSCASSCRNHSFPCSWIKRPCYVLLNMLAFIKMLFIKQHFMSLSPILWPSRFFRSLFYHVPTGSFGGDHRCHVWNWACDGPLFWALWHVEVRTRHCLVRKESFLTRS